MHIAAGNTLTVALSATLIVTVLGVAAAVGLAGSAAAGRAWSRTAFLGR